jgi:lactoylglutathione lyase
VNLNHLNLTVTDVPVTRAFLAKHFGLKDMGGNINMAFLSDGSGLVLTLTSMKVGGDTAVRYPVTFHVGFIQPSEARVNEINRRLKEVRHRRAAAVTTARRMDVLLRGARRVHDRGALLTGVSVGELRSRSTVITRTRLVGRRRARPCLPARDRKGRCRG